ncbi:hypothetical protein C7212DRAFT_314102 [Tuber magnatum]|uniref:Uncharacterized protein n=1 Tax=Tuber magnatum TaxID=42249 RepID=A0A317STY4_9PEZI|nr:hypothetical protein C7212DRAFT_314102 [Tuber magnatum]
MKSRDESVGQLVGCFLSLFFFCDPFAEMVDRERENHFTFLHVFLEPRVLYLPGAAEVLMRMNGRSETYLPVGQSVNQTNER